MYRLVQLKGTVWHHFLKAFSPLVLNLYRCTQEPGLSTVIMGWRSEAEPFSPAWSSLWFQDPATEVEEQVSCFGIVMVFGFADVCGNLRAVSGFLRSDCG